MMLSYLCKCPEIDENSWELWTIALQHVTQRQTNYVVFHIYSKTMSLFASFNSSSFSSGYKNVRVPYSLGFQSNATVFNEEYDSFHRDCEAMISYESGIKSHHEFTLSPWSVIFDFGGRHIKYELVKRSDGSIGPVWRDIERSSPIIAKAIKALFFKLLKKDKVNFDFFRLERFMRVHDRSKNRLALKLNKTLGGTNPILKTSKRRSTISARFGS